MFPRSLRVVGPEWNSTSPGSKATYPCPCCEEAQQEAL